MAPNTDVISEKITEEDTKDDSQSSTSANANEFFLPLSQGPKRLPGWLDHFNSSDLKLLFKCSITVWIFTILIVINPTLRAIGQATFFGVIVLFIAPPSGHWTFELLAVSTIAIGVFLAWAWGVITMEAALATRPAADLQAQLEALQQAATANTTNVRQASGQATFQQIAIFEGFMLDTRVTVTYFCMLGLFIYLVARIRVAAPKLVLVQIFAVQVTDVFLTIGPLIPTFSGTLPQTLVVPAGIAVGLGLVCNLLFFPQSTSYIVMDDMQKLLAPMGDFLEASAIHLANPIRRLDLDRLKKSKGAILQLYSSMEGNLKFLALDISMCRWSAGDVKCLHDPIRHVMVSFITLLQVDVTRLEFVLKDQALLDAAEKSHASNDKEVVAGANQIAKAFDLRQTYRHPDKEAVDNIILQEYGKSSKNLMFAVRGALIATIEAVHNINDKRWFGRLSVSEVDEAIQRHREALEHLKTQISSFPSIVAEQLRSTNLDTSSDIAARQQQGTVHLLVLEDRLLTFSTALAALLEQIVSLEAERKKIRLWGPSSIKDIVPLAFDKDSDDNGLEPQIVKIQKNAARDQERKKHKQSAENVNSIEHAKMRISQHRGKRQRSLLGRLTINIAHWFSNTEGLFALRLSILSLGLASVAVNRNTAGFFYRENGLWALIMAQLSLVPYTADFIYGIFLALLGTIVGAVAGLAVWYIGAGSGPGNPYGIAAIMAPVIVILMWLRLFTSPAFLQGVIITTATIYLVVVYSWVDTHIPTYGNPGVGVEVFWRRLLLVLVGCAAATFVTLFPRPPSANRHYRRILSSSLQTNKDQYALFVTARASEYKPEEVRKVIEQTAISLAQTLQAIEPLIPLTRFELSTSNFDAKALGLACHLSQNINQYIAQLGIFAALLPENMKVQFFHGTGAASEDLIADIMAVLTLVQHALTSGEPLPTILPSPLMEKRIAVMKTRLDEMNMDITRLHGELLMHKSLRQYLSAITAFIHLLGSIDELVLVVKRAVGETSYIDLEA